MMQFEVAEDGIHSPGTAQGMVETDDLAIPYEEYISSVSDFCMRAGASAPSEVALEGWTWQFTADECMSFKRAQSAPSWALPTSGAVIAATSLSIRSRRSSSISCSRRSCQSLSHCLPKLLPSDWQVLMDA
jgi:hypothetical protein